jgi:hypothetical protein
VQKISTILCFSKEDWISINKKKSQKNNKNCKMNSNNNNNQNQPLQLTAHAEIEMILQNVVAPRSRVRYMNENVKLLLWAYDEGDELRGRLLHEDFINDINIGVQNATTAKAKAKTKRVIIKRWYNGIKKNSPNCPLNLDNLTFDDFSTYLTTRKSKTQRYLAKSSYDGIRSALAHMYRLTGKVMKDDLLKNLKEFMGGIKRTAVTEKKESGVSLDEGKKSMSYEVYSMLCSILSKGDSDEHLFAHAYLTLEWNLMARSENVNSCHINHISWNADSLLFYFPLTKGNQGGENNHVPWHVYSNPFEPHLCPVLALAKYIVAQAGILKSGSKLFPGNHQYDRFMKIFKRVIHENINDFRELGIEEGDLGSHSCRKGAITHVSSGCTVSPPMSSICLRAGWSMGPIKDRYIHFEKAGDQFVGRCATTISSMTKEFAVSPCYFDTTNEENDNLDKKIDSILSNYLVSGNDMCANMFLLMKKMFAAICYHFNHLQNTEHEQSALRSSALFQAAAANIDVREAATIKFPWNKTEQTPTATGLPPHVVLQAEMEELKMKMEQSKKDIIEAMGKELDDRNIGGDAFQSTRILEQVNQMHQQISTMLEGGGQMSGNASNGNIQNNVFELGDNDEAPALDLEEPSTRDESITDIAGAVVPTRFQLNWSNLRNGQIQLLPKDYKFPVMPLSNFIGMWYCGDKTNRIPPYRMLGYQEMKSIKGGKQKICNMRKMIKYIERAAACVGREELVRGAFSIPKAILLYESIRHLFEYPSLRITNQRRFDSISWKTFYNLVSKNGGRFVGEAIEAPMIQQQIQ